MDYEYESCYEFDNILKDTENYLQEMASVMEVNYYDDELLMEGLVELEFFDTAIQEGIISTVWGAIVNMVKSLIKALISLFKGIINFFKSVFRFIKNLFRALLGLPPVEKSVSYIAIESANLDIANGKSNNKDIVDKINRACERMSKELQILNKTQMKIVELIKKDTERKAREEQQSVQDSYDMYLDFKSTYIQNNTWDSLLEITINENYGGYLC